MPKIILNDEETGFLYAMVYRARETDRLRKHNYKPLKTERAARSIANSSLRNKIRRALPRGSARAIEILQETVF